MEFISLFYPIARNVKHRIIANRKKNEKYTYKLLYNNTINKKDDLESRLLLDIYSSDDTPVYNKALKVIKEVASFYVFTSGATGNPQKVYWNDTSVRRLLNVFETVFLEKYTTIKDFDKVVSYWKKIYKENGKIIPLLSGTPYTPIAPSYHYQSKIVKKHEKLLGIKFQVIHIENMKKIDSILSELKSRHIKEVVVVAPFHILKFLIKKLVEYNIRPAVIGTGGERIPMESLMKLAKELDNPLYEETYSSSEFAIGYNIGFLDDILQETKSYGSKTTVIHIPIAYNIILGYEISEKNLEEPRTKVFKEIIENKEKVNSVNHFIKRRIIGIFTPLYMPSKLLPPMIYKNYIGLWDSFIVEDINYERGLITISDIKRVGFEKIGDALVDLYQLSYDLESKLGTIVRIHPIESNGIKIGLRVDVYNLNNLDKKAIEEGIFSVLKNYIALYDEISRGTVVLDIKVYENLENKKWEKAISVIK